jgi:sensor histidine kinase YesM
MKTSSMPLKIRISAKLNKGFFSVEVINTGKWIDGNSNENAIDRGTGTGIENVKMRLENAFKDNYSFNIKEENDTVNVTLQIKQV